MKWVAKAVRRWLHGTGPDPGSVIDLAEVSAGGGSIARIDPAGALRVGPRSAGAADPFVMAVAERSDSHGRQSRLGISRCGIAPRAGCPSITMAPFACSKKIATPRTDRPGQAALIVNNNMVNVRWYRSNAATTRESSATGGRACFMPC